MTTKDQLQQEINERRRKLDAMEAAERKAENLPLVGKCFKYRNNYSVPEKPSDYWWLYVKVLSADGYSLTTFEFQTDKYGELFIKPRSTHSRNMSVGYQPISSAEFQRAWTAVKRKMAKLR